MLGAEHRDTLNCGSALAASYLMEGGKERIRESVRLLEEILPICKARLGSDDLVTLSCMNNLGRGYFALGEYDKAADVHEEDVAIRKAKFGPGHRNTLVSMVNLANVYHKQEHYEKALGTRLQTLELQRKNLGPKDPDTLMTAHNIGANYRQLKNYVDALRYDQETLAARTETLTRDHPDTLSSLWSVGKDLMYLERGAEGLPFLDECLDRAKGRNIHSNFRDVADVRLRYFEKKKDATGCRTTAELWEKQKRTDDISLYQAACCRAVTAAVIRATDQSPAAAKQAQDEADLAMGWLHQAIARGYKDVGKFKNDLDLDSLRDRTDFKKLLADFEVSPEKDK
jgi:tetratricopeptide (TPR) repeat protein